MSCDQWEGGTLKLPTAAESTVRRAVRTGALAHRKAVADLIAEFWTKHGKTARTSAKWSDSTHAFIDAKSSGYYRLDDAVVEDLSHILWRVGVKPHKPTVADIDQVLGASPTNRTLSYSAGEASIVFGEHTVTWHVSGNRAVDRGREHPIAVALFQALSKITWTRGSGGELIGNDEYNQDSRESGGGANYTTQRFGPLGAATDPWQSRKVRKTTASKTLTRI